MLRKNSSLLMLFCFALVFSIAPAQENKRVVLQGFYWNYWNDNYPNAWSDYLANLSSRLRNEARIDAVWIPPSYKNDTPISSGYSPFDHYDLGDKYQKGNLVTRMGNKDQLLRMIAIMHSNGLEVHQDVVLNHVINAGAVGGFGGQDPESWGVESDGVTRAVWKNFRYVGFATPATIETALNYWTRAGRWSKNWQNFHPNPYHDTQSGDWASPFWGPDFCYGTTPNGIDNGHGESSNIHEPNFHNPLQNDHYNFEQARDWLKWFVRQTDVDGFRWDAVKHFPPFVMGDVSEELSVNNLEWSFGNDFVNVGEFFDNNAGLLDGFTNDANGHAGGDLTGTFDFSLRHGFLQMTQQDGGFDVGSLPALQQMQRSRTATWVENHDTFRPTFDGSYNYNGWEGSSLAEHIDPNDGRKQAAYAASFAMDGNHNVFFEDLFVLNTTDRNSHQPSDAAALPMRDYLVNIIWCFQNLNFEDGAYLVPHQSGDHLIIEREDHAIIGITDHWTNQQNQWIQSSFNQGVTLHDYSGSFADRVVGAGGWVEISTPPCDGTNPSGRRGYSIWGPAGIVDNYLLAPQSTTQEWELADDLGDSHANSLLQGGAIYKGTNRYAGRIYAEAGHAITIDVHKENNIHTQTRIVQNGTILATSSGDGDNQIIYVPAQTGHYDIFVRRLRISLPQYSQTGLRAWVKVNYTAPTEIAPADLIVVPVQFPDEEEDDINVFVSNVYAYPNPFKESCRINVELNVSAQISLAIFDQQGTKLETLANGFFKEGLNSFAVVPKTRDAVLIYKLIVNESESYTGTVLVEK